MTSSAHNTSNPDYVATTKLRRARSLIDCSLFAAKRTGKEAGKQFKSLSCFTATFSGRAIILPIHRSRSVRFLNQLSLMRNVVRHVCLCWWWKGREAWTRKSTVGEPQRDLKNGSSCEMPRVSVTGGLAHECAWAERLL